MAKEEEKKEDKTSKATEAEEGEGGEGGEGEGGGGSKGGFKKKKLIIIALSGLLLLSAAGGAVFFGENLARMLGMTEKVDESTIPQIVYFDLEEFLVNLNNPGKQVSFLKMTITLELPNLATKASVEAKMPRIRDSFQVYLRELRNSDLQGSAGIQRLREELTLRINKILEPEVISDILFKEIVVQ